MQKSRAVEIQLVPIGPTSVDLISQLADQLAEIFETRVSVGEKVAIPLEAYDVSRGQYRGDVILDTLRALAYPEAERIVGLIDQDCYAMDLNFIFGQVARGGQECFVALPRLRQGFYGLSEDAGLFRTRVLKEIEHELGHTWGLSHCGDPRCVMYFSNTLADTDGKGVRYCQRCQAQLR